MTGGELTIVWLFGILMAAVTVMAVAKVRADAQVTVERLKAEAARAWREAQVQLLQGPTFMPPEWTKDGGL